MRASADFLPEYSSSYFVPRATVEPPEGLLQQIWPELDRWVPFHLDYRQPDPEIQPNLAAGAFIELLLWLRKVLLQDAVFMREEFPPHPIFRHPLFSQPAFEAFATAVRGACAEAHEDCYQDAIEKAIPAVADKLYNLGSQQLAISDQIARQHAKLKERVDQLQRSVDEMAAGWEITSFVTPKGRTKVTQATHVSNGQVRLTSPCPPSRQDGASNDGPSQPGTLALPQAHTREEGSAEVPPTYNSPRSKHNVEDLWEMWHHGKYGLPPITSLNERWGHHWRPASEREFYGVRLAIIEEIQRRASLRGLAEREVAREMDRKEGGREGLNKLGKQLRKEACERARSC